MNDKQQPKSVRDIVREYLEANGYDGLAGYGCGCLKDDLGPCESDYLDCVPGYKVPDPTGESDWIVSPTRDAKEVCDE